VWILCHGNQYQSAGVDAKSGETELLFVDNAWGSLIVVECCSMPISGSGQISKQIIVLCFLSMKERAKVQRMKRRVNCRLQFRRCFFVFTIVVAQTLSSWEGKSTSVAAVWKLHARKSILVWTEECEHVINKFIRPTERTLKNKDSASALVTLPIVKVGLLSFPPTMNAMLIIPLLLRTCRKDAKRP